VQAPKISKKFPKNPAPCASPALRTCRWPDTQDPQRIHHLVHLRRTRRHGFPDDARRSAHRPSGRIERGRPVATTGLGLGLRLVRGICKSTGMSFSTDQKSAGYSTILRIPNLQTS
jgi:hypothetical protein